MTGEEWYTPEESKRRSPLLTLIIAGILTSIPCISAGVLLVVNPEYMAQLTYGPPEGAYIPGKSIPLGLPVIGAAVLLALICLVVNLLFVRWTRKNKLPVKVILPFAIFLFLNFILQTVACLLITLGPTAIQIVKEFSVPQ